MGGGWVNLALPCASIGGAHGECPQSVERRGDFEHPGAGEFAGVFAGVAGALTAVTSGIVGLDSAGFPWSAEALVMLVLGGTGRLYGAVIGTAAFMGIYHILAASDPFHWMGFIGLFLIGIVLFLPGGIASGVERLGGLLRGKEDRA